MRFSRQRYKLKYQEGQVRDVKKFLWYPRSFDTKEWRFFETAIIIEKVMKVDIGGSMQWGKYAWKWVEIGFRDKTE